MALALIASGGAGTTYCPQIRTAFSNNSTMRNLCFGEKMGAEGRNLASILGAPDHIISLQTSLEVIGEF